MRRLSLTSCSRQDMSARMLSLFIPDVSRDVVKAFTKFTSDGESALTVWCTRLTNAQ